jgi:hypothetical protein
VSHDFEPMKDSADLTSEGRRFGYPNALDGRYRFKAVASLLAPLVHG